jgi:hypothetical protein
LNDGTRRNGVDTEEQIYRITYFGKGRMPVSFPLKSKYRYLFFLDFGQGDHRFCDANRDSVRVVLQEDSAHLDHGCRMKRLSSWLNLWSHKQIKAGQTQKLVKIDSCKEKQLCPSARNHRLWAIPSISHYGSNPF